MLNCSCQYFISEVLGDIKFRISCFIMGNLIVTNISVQIDIAELNILYVLTKISCIWKSYNSESYNYKRIANSWYMGSFNKLLKFRIKFMLYNITHYQILFKFV